MFLQPPHGSGYGTDVHYVRPCLSVGRNQRINVVNKLRNRELDIKKMLKVPIFFQLPERCRLKLGELAPDFNNSEW